ncbi:MAG: hypothetical protein HRU70_01010 [Phycisphaeraceae bacterium]|nr:MAG: hypothetical protein HRU70_01010 [Phycisphaeraceae bacterium]
MAERARVESVGALAELRAALLRFAEEVQTTLAGVDADIGRVGQWLSSERPGHWKHEVRRREDEVERCRTAVMRKRIIQAPEPASVLEERKAFDAAKRRLESAVARAASVRRWASVWEREAQMYKSATAGLSETVSGTIPGAAARLERMIRAVEAYAGVRAVTEETGTGAVLEGSVAGPEEGVGEAGVVAHRFASLRGHALVGEGRAGVVVSSIGSGWRWSAGGVTPEDAEGLGRLSLAGPGLDVGLKVVVAWRAMESAAVGLIRGPGSAGDSGWTVVALERPEVTGGWRGVPAGEAAGNVPGLGAVLSLAEGTVVVLSAGRVVSVLDGDGRDVWNG